jgi:hypothetical protein
MTFKNLVDDPFQYRRRSTGVRGLAIHVPVFGNELRDVQRHSGCEP